MENEKTESDAQPNLSKEEEIAFHKGALTVLLKERQELARLLAIVQQLIGIHVKRLEQLGVKVGRTEQEEKNKEKKKE